jgi:hypothetical protein
MSMRRDMIRPASARFGGVATSRRTAMQESTVDRPPSSHEEPPRSRLEDEVLEILTKSDRPPSNVVKFQSKVRQKRYTAPNRLRASTANVRITSFSLLVAMIVLAILAAVIEDRSALIGRVLALLSLACLIALFVRRWVRPEQPQIKTWRGRDVDFRPPPRRPEWLDRLMGGPRGPRR